MCKQEKPITEFYKDANRYDGIGQKCKICSREFSRSKRLRNPETYKKMAKRCYEKNKEKRLEYHRKWRETNKYKTDAHLLVRNAMKKGELERKPCIECGSLNSDAHHEDYNKPLDVIWLCRIHHIRHHHK